MNRAEARQAAILDYRAEIAEATAAFRRAIGVTWRFYGKPASPSQACLDTFADYQNAMFRSFREAGRRLDARRALADINHAH